MISGGIEVNQFAQTHLKETRDQNFAPVFMA